MEENKATIKTLREWFNSQRRFKTQKEFAEAVGIPRSTIGHYLRGNETPSGERRKKLYEVTGLECFKSETDLSRETEVEEEMKEPSGEKDLPVHIQLQNWFSSQTRYETRKEFAKAAGIGYSNLNKYFRGESQPSLDIKERLYNITRLEIFGQEIGITKEKKSPEGPVEIPTPPDIQEKIKELQKIISDLREKVGTFDGICEKCIANKLPKSTDQSSVRERVEVVKELLYALNRELEFFKKASPDNREMFRKRIHAPDVGYITALLRALFDEDKFQSWLYMSSYDIKRR